MSKIIILGAGEHGRVVEYYCRKLDIDVIGFLDDSHKIGTAVNDVSVIGPFEYAFHQEFGDDVGFHVAIGDTQIRRAVYERLRKHKLRLITIVHPTAEIALPCNIGDGAYVGAFSLVSVNVQIENYAIIHAHNSVSPDVRVGTAAWIAPGCLLSRASSVGDGSFVGTGSIVLPEVSIGTQCVIGAGSLVTKDIPNSCKAYGSPCRIVERFIDE